jgi:osmotically-inducible protein OsmY
MTQAVFIFIRILLVALVILVIWGLFRPEGVRDPVDIWTDAEVRAAIDLHPELKFHSIDVRSNAGVVTLRGHVATKAQRALAEALSLGVPSVAEVHNEIQVGGETSSVPEAGAGTNADRDAELAHQLQAILLANRHTSHLHPQIYVKDGSVVLEGKVPEELDRIEVELVVAGTQGVERVDNRLAASSEVVESGQHLLPAIFARGQSKVIDEWVQARVDLLLHYSKLAAGQQILATTKDRTVTLQGETSSTEQGEQIAAAVGQIMGVEAVHNNLQVRRAADSAG